MTTHTAFSDLATRPEYLAYNTEVLYGDVKQRIADAQNHIPAGQAFVAWVMTPFYFNYSRNVIYDVNPAGLASGWAYRPEEADYFMMEYAGYAVRPISKYLRYLQDPGQKPQAEIVLNFLRANEKKYRNAEVLYDDGKIVVVKIKNKL